MPERGAGPPHGQLLADLHSRPAPQLRGPATVSYWATLGRTAAPHGFASETGASTVVEHHHEFTSFTATFPHSQSTLFDPARMRMAPTDPAIAVLVEIISLPETEAEVASLAQRHLNSRSMILTWVAEELVAVATDFQPTDDGPMRLLVMTSSHVGPGRVGRVVRRLLEVETYRALSMMALDNAQSLGTRLDELEPRMLRLVERMDDPALAADETLHELLDVSAELEALASRHDFRFAAAHAYEAIVSDRLNVLNETRFAGRQLLSEFLALRYTPAMRTVTSTEQRLHRLIDRAGRAGDLLRTRVEVAHSSQNAAMLISLDSRAQAQLRLQHAVEGLSVFAVSYYAVSLLAYLLAPGADAVGVEESWVKAGLAPSVLLVVWLSVRQVRHRPLPPENPAE